MFCWVCLTCDCPMINSGESALAFLNWELLKLKIIIYLCHSSEDSSEYVYAALVWPC